MESEEERESGGRPAPEVPCLDKALQLLALRAHFVAELRSKLQRRGYEQDEVAGTLRLLEQDGTLDDLRTASDFVDMRRRRRGEATYRLRAELLRRGVADSVIDTVLSEIDPEEQADAAIEMALRRAARGASEASIGRYLGRKGFGQRDILRALEECRRQASGDHELP